MPLTQKEVTDLLIQWSEGDAEALERLMPLVFEELRHLARFHFQRETDGHTLQPTALVNEVYMRLVDQRRVQWDNRRQFFAFAATLMRRILVDHAKGRRAVKRGGDVRKVPLDEALGVSDAPDVDLVALDEALSRLAAIDPRQARIVELRHFAGLGNEEIAEVLDISPTTVKREWKTARLWLYQTMQRS
jgi:RNA polymerase sigma factor (TIGR02999 family)